MNEGIRLMLLRSETSGLFETHLLSQTVEAAVYFTTDTCLIPDAAYALDPLAVIVHVCCLSQGVVIL